MVLVEENYLDITSELEETEEQKKITKKVENSKNLRIMILKELLKKWISFLKEILNTKKL